MREVGWHVERQNARWDMTRGYEQVKSRTNTRFRIIFPFVTTMSLSLSQNRCQLSQTSPYSPTTLPPSNQRTSKTIIIANNTPSIALPSPYPRPKSIYPSSIPHHPSAPHDHKPIKTIPLHPLLTTFPLSTFPPKKPPTQTA